MGQTLRNRYQVAAILGQSDRGAVYQAYDERLGIDCVVKELYRQHITGGTSDAETSFWREASNLSRLAHPDLPRVTDYFQEGGAYYLVMDLVTGQSLQALIGSRLPEQSVLNDADQVLDALDYLHSQGVVHGDIKPANVVVDPGGRAVLVGYEVIQGASRASAYAPPERDMGDADPRSDIYSLGATLYHALTGQAPVNAARRVAGAPL